MMVDIKQIGSVACNQLTTTLYALLKRDKP